jgi:hypothetical protein
MHLHPGGILSVHLAEDSLLRKPHDLRQGYLDKAETAIPLSIGDKTAVGINYV